MLYTTLGGNLSSELGVAVVVQMRKTQQGTAKGIKEAHVSWTRMKLISKERNEALVISRSNKIPTCNLHFKSNLRRMKPKFANPRPSTLTLPGIGPVTSLTHRKMPWRSISRNIDTNGVFSKWKLLHKLALMWIWSRQEVPGLIKLAQASNVPIGLV
jgi:hypothetical protein